MAYSTRPSPTRTAPVSTLHELVAKAPSAWLPQLPVRLTNVGRWSFNNFELIQKTGPSGQPRVAQGHRGAPSQIAQPPWLPLSGLVYGNNGSKVHFCFLSLLCSIILHAVLRAVRGTSRRFMASWRPLMIFIRFSSSSQWWEWEHLCKSWKYSAKHCKVVASMSSLVFLGCSKAVTSTHKNVVKTLKVWGILSDNLVHFGLRIAKHWQSPEPIQILHVFLFLYTPPTRGPFTMPLYFSHYTKRASASFPSSKMAWSNWKNSPQVPCQWFCWIQWSLWMSG